MTKPLPLDALRFAIDKHDGQHRKYTGEPYVQHPINVAEILINSFPAERGVLPVNVIRAALLHDVIEDCDVTYSELNDAFGPDVTLLVHQVSDKSRPDDGNRAARKAIDRDWYSIAEPRAKCIKLADSIDNTKSIVANDGNFAKVYLREKRALLKVLEPTADESAKYGSWLIEWQLSLWAEATRQVTLGCLKLKVSL
jgi:(p)ppGpp synthase/HD superfamily hydrolase